MVFTNEHLNRVFLSVFITKGNKYMKAIFILTLDHERLE